MLNIEQEFGKAIAHFWKTRRAQSDRQGRKTGQRDTGKRTAVTGGKHADGFIEFIAKLVSDAGLPKVAIHKKAKNERTLPGYFRPTKEWDLTIVSGNDLIAVVEVKSQVGSFGNNFNNRVEEAVGNATDLWTAYKHGAFKPSQRPWLGYMFILEQCAKSTAPMKKIVLPTFAVDDQFQEKSYAARYELVCERFVRESLYDAVCFVVSNEGDGMKGKYVEPNRELGVENFATALHARAGAVARLKPADP